MIDARAFGPSQETQDARTALGAAKSVTGLGRLAGANIPFADTALGIGHLLTDPSTEGALKFAGQALTSPSTYQAAASLAEHGLPSLASIGDSIASAGTNVANFVSGLPGSAASLASSVGPAAAQIGTGLAFSLFAGGGPLKFLDTPDGDPVRRMRRTRDATSLVGETLAPFRSGERDPAKILANPVGGSTTGDALASILNYNQGGGWSDSSLNWLPDPSLSGLQRAIHARGFPGTAVENGEIVRREPQRNDVGGVGEMVASGALPIPPGAYPAEWFSPGVASDEGGQMTNIGPYAQPADDTHDSMAWEALLRQIGGVPAGTPTAFDPRLRSGLEQLFEPDAMPAMYEGDGALDAANAWRAQQAESLAMADDYLGTLDPEIAERIELKARGDRERRLARTQDDGGGD